MRYYKLGETPAYYITAWYKLLSGKWEFGKVHATETTVEGVTVELTTADGSEYADMHRLARADFPNCKQIVHEILHPEDRPAPQSSYSHYSGINYSALEVAVRRIQQDFDFLMRYLPKLPDDSYAKTETLKILKQHKAYMAQFEEMLNDEKIA